VAARLIKHLGELEATIAAGAGVEVLVYACEMSPGAIRLSHRMRWART